MKDDRTKAVKLTPADMAIVDAVRNKLGLRSVSEVLRAGIRALAREQGIDCNPPPRANVSVSESRSTKPPRAPVDDGGASEFLDADAAELLPRKSYIVAPADETDPNWKMTEEQLESLK
jgi:hypothetical protein